MMCVCSGTQHSPDIIIAERTLRRQSASVSAKRDVPHAPGGRRLTRRKLSAPDRPVSMLRLYDRPAQSHFLRHRNRPNPAATRRPPSRGMRRGRAGSKSQTDAAMTRGMSWRDRAQEIKIGDTVAYSKAFLQSISAYTGDLPRLAARSRPSSPSAKKSRWPRSTGTCRTCPARQRQESVPRAGHLLRALNGVRPAYRRRGGKTSSVTSSSSRSRVATSRPLYASPSRSAARLRRNESRRPTLRLAAAPA